MRYPNCIFDLYGTLVDIHTDENKPELWSRMAQWYRERGACYTPEELQQAYQRCVRQREQGTNVLRKDAHEAHPEIQLEYVFQELFQEKGVDASIAMAAEHSGPMARGYTCCPMPSAFSRNVNCGCWASKPCSTAFICPRTTAVRSRIAVSLSCR